MIGVDIIFAVGVVVVTILIGFLIKWIAAMFLSEREASIAAFSLMLGNTIGVLLFVATYDYALIADSLGTIFGLAALWWLLFKREVVHG